MLCKDLLFCHVAQAGPKSVVLSRLTLQQSGPMCFSSMLMEVEGVFFSLLLSLLELLIAADCFEGRERRCRCAPKRLELNRAAKESGHPTVPRSLNVLIQCTYYSTAHHIING